MKTILKQLDKEIGKAYYEACKQLLTPLTDREFEKLCVKHNELFSKLSTLDHSKIEEFEAMTMDELVDYVSSLIYNKGKINLYDLVKELEKL